MERASLWAAQKIKYCSYVRIILSTTYTPPISMIRASCGPGPAKVCTAPLAQQAGNQTGRDWPAALGAVEEQISQPTGSCMEDQEYHLE